MNKKTPNKMENNYDVVIVGAGPAGAAASRELVGSGYRVLVVEKKKLPRYKICSGLVMERAQDLLIGSFGEPPVEVFSKPDFLKGSRLSISGKALTDLPVGRPRIYNVWRSTFDSWLISQSGADILESHRLVDFTQSEHGVEATIEGPGPVRRRVEARYLIGADGGISHTRRLLDPGFEGKIGYSTFVQLYCSAMIDLDPEYYYLFFDQSLSAFYTWLHVKDDTLVYGIGAHSGGLISQCIQDSTDYLAKRFGLKVEEVKRKTGCLVSNMAVRGTYCLGRGRVLLAGEAAGYVNVFGEGISSALATGQLAARAIHKAETSDRDAFPVYANLSQPEQKRTTQSWEITKSMKIRF
jgi:menaquinone-9 beta-reductase